MSDCCWLDVWVRRDQAILFINELGLALPEGVTCTDTLVENIEKRGWAGYGVTENWVKLFEEEVNYGLTAARAKAASDKGIIFVGSHGAGGSYGAFRFWSDGEACYEWASGHLGEGYVIGDPHTAGTERALEKLREFCKREQALWDEIRKEQLHVRSTATAPRGRP